MSFIRRINDFIRLTKEDKKIFRSEISPENVRRIFYLSLLALPVNLTTIFIFWTRLSSSSGVEYQWRTGVIYSHFSILITFLVISALLYFFAFKKKETNILAKICINLVVFVLLSAGTVLTAFDQLVTTSITPVIISSLIAALVLIIRPHMAIHFFLLNAIVFYIAMEKVQMDEAVRVSNQVNGITISAIGLLLSMILWRFNLTRIKQQKLISIQNQELVEANASRDKFFSIIAHDLKSPMTTILGFVEVLESSLDKDEPEKSKEYLSIISDTSKQTLTLLENLLAWSRAQTGRMHFTPENIELVPLIRERIRNFSGQLQAKNLQIIFNPSDMPVIAADREMLMTILRNLLSNAIKFSHPGKSIVVTLHPVDEYVIISVTDNGIGIREEKIGQLFNLASTPVAEGTAHERGSGIGLLLCKEMVERHGGEISVTSEFGKGTTVSFTLPVKNEALTQPVQE